jgi:hypothetical protein
MPSNRRLNSVHPDWVPRQDQFTIEGAPQPRRNRVVAVASAAAKPLRCTIALTKA